MKIINNKIEAKADITKLTPHPSNPRNGDVEAIGASVDALGFYGVVVAQVSTGRILAGNHRYHVAMEQGAKHIPVAWVDVDDKQALKILLADNRSSDLAKQDDQQLAHLLTELGAVDEGLTGTGYDGDDLETLLRKLAASGPIDVDAEWDGMPAYSATDLKSVFHTTVHFASDDDSVAFFKLLGVQRGASIWWPASDGHVGSSLKEEYVEASE